eukprot:CAMPEP_0198539008 /NCGR_PEP_ID=MMETSP1462-20131121/48179_1 /TAXON_ID=1333877 /ORGANISM="Brandtodinium nutriculum, Strain RCC3387" /LENGTH=65 /DNA_ID=CAMNT_0044269049 /DNA_START=12 /DNA_END=209 /DNA_ORIENTATION=-
MPKRTIGDYRSYLALYDILRCFFLLRRQAAFCTSVGVRFAILRPTGSSVVIRWPVGGHSSAVGDV